MDRVPFVGRLHLREYTALIGSLVLIALEIFVRIVTLALPTSVLHFLHNQSRNLFNSLSSPAGRKSRAKRKEVVNPIAHAADFVDLCALYGYYTEEHVVQTKDGYLLGIHRLANRPGEEDQRVNAGRGSVQKKVAYLHHGLMMNSDVWVCISEKERCLPFQLVERGYDVWLGNNRGNKYSKKNVRLSPNSREFWDFSIDEFAFHDIPDTINYILTTTKQPSLSYIGFSQGTAQAFATLSIHPSLNEKVDVFVALAPAMSPPGLANGIVSSLVNASPSLLFLAFGRKSILSSSTMWQAILFPPIFVRIIDTSLGFLFGWHTHNITAHQKLAAYPHLYSFASTKCVVHWFQIITGGTFQMYDDEVQAPMSFSTSKKYYKVAKFPTRNIKTPIVLVYGGSDSLVNIDVMLRELPKHTVANEIPKYEHLDFLWASDVDKLVFPHVFDALDFYTGGSKVKMIEAAKEKVMTPVRPPQYSKSDEGRAGQFTNGHLQPVGQSPPNTSSSSDSHTNSRTSPSEKRYSSRVKEEHPRLELLEPGGSSGSDVWTPMDVIENKHVPPRSPRRPQSSSAVSDRSSTSRSSSDGQISPTGIDIGPSRTSSAMTNLDGENRSPKSLSPILPSQGKKDKKKKSVRV